MKCTICFTEGVKLSDVLLYELDEDGSESAVGTPHSACSACRSEQDWNYVLAEV